MKSLFEMKQNGRALRKHLETAFGREVTLSQAYEALAAIEGAENWNALSAKLIAAPVPATFTDPSLLRTKAAALPPIRAIFRTVDGKAIAEFDASPWFAQATDDQIKRLKDERPCMAPVGYELSYGAGGVADTVAEFCANSDEGVKLVFAYIKTTAALGIDCGGSDCYINVHDVQGWLGAWEASSKESLSTPSKGVAPAHWLPADQPESTGSAEEAPGLAMRLNVLKVMEVNLVDVLNEYDAPDDVSDWQWVENHHSFAHKGNGGEPGVWEFMVSVEKMQFVDDIPDTLRPFFDRARKEGAAWVMFHQG